MKKVLIAINLIFISAALAVGQNSKFKKDSNNFPDEDGPRAAGNQKSGSENKASDDENDSEKMLLRSGTVLDAKLLSSLNAENAEVGDEVILKVTNSIKQDGEVVVPKGTRLIGRVTEVKRKSKDDKSSKLSMIFEKLQNKSLSAPINASIVSIASAAGNLQAGDMFGSSASGRSSSSGTASGGSGGGLLGGATSTAGSVLGATTGAVGGVSDTVGGTVHGTRPAVGRTLKGIRLSQGLNVNAEGSSTLSAENKNIKLNTGTRFRLQLNESVEK